jgi:hypothetical protein
MTDRIKIKVSGKTYEKCPADGYTIVNAKHFEALKDYKLYWTPDGYVNIHFKDNEKWQYLGLHGYIVDKFENIVIPKGHIVHHKNSNKFDNDINNLEVATHSMNAAAIIQPKRSSTNTTIYKGITFNKKKNKWLSQITYNKKCILLQSCDTDKDAAFEYDKAYFAIHGSTSGSNNLLTDKWKEKISKKKEDFLPVSKNSTRILPKYIYLVKGKYKVQIRGKHHYIQKIFTQLEYAIKFVKEFWDDVENNKQEELMSRPIIRNDQGIAIIPVVDKINNIIKYAFVDDSDYYNVVSKKWIVNEKGYAIHNRCISMHRFIMNCTAHDGRKVDHKNHNRMDNRKSENLRFITDSLNSRNTVKKEGTLSKYVGVSWNKENKKWITRISKKGKNIHIGCFDCEEAAHNAYHTEYKKLEEENRLYHENRVQ